jgi:antitoxin CptB
LTDAEPNHPRDTGIGVDDRCDRARLRWRCRRGMRELDVLLIHFFEASFDGLSASEKLRFQALLELPDPDLQAYLIAGHASADPDLESLLVRIRTSLHP